MSDSEFLDQILCMQMYAMGSTNWSGGNRIVEKEKQQQSTIDQDVAICGPEKGACLTNQTLKENNCLVSCNGLYADILDGSLKQDVVKGW